MQFGRIVIVAVLALLDAGMAYAQDGPWTQYRGLDALEIRYANGPIDARQAPDIWLKLHGSAPRRFSIDTGLTGIAVSAQHFEPGPGDVDDGPGRLIHASSGRILEGERYTTDVVIQRDGRTPVATARVQVLRVTAITCMEGARDCRPRSQPRGITLMGVGFDRYSAQGTKPDAPRNPFTNLVSLASGKPVSSVRSGYVLSRNALHLGMTVRLARDFAFVKLKPSAASRPGAPAWSRPPATVSVDGVVGKGAILMDTGIGYMSLSPPPGTVLTPGARVPAGTKIAIYLPDKRTPQPAFYSFTVGERSNRMQPRRVEIVRGERVFVNTGRLFLEGFDYLYDAVGGYVGYRWNRRVDDTVGGVTPGLTKPD